MAHTMNTSPRSDTQLQVGSYYKQAAILAGMTETSPLATVGGLKAAIATMPEEQQLKVVEKAGRPHILVDMRIVDDNGKEVRHDAKTSGKLQVRGHMVLQKYYKVSDMLAAADRCPLKGLILFSQVRQDIN